MLPKRTTNEAFRSVKIPVLLRTCSEWFRIVRKYLPQLRWILLWNESRVLAQFRPIEAISLFLPFLVLYASLSGRV